MRKIPSLFRSRSALFVLFLMTCSPFGMRSQTAVPVVPQIRITSRNDQKISPMKLRKLSVDIRIMGQMAVTTLDMEWFNSNQVILEGSFEFPLAEGQSVSGFALDIDGRMRDGVVVEKEKGRAVFEAIVRRKVDPGLLEVTTGNNYRARIYPLPPNGTRRIIITVEQELTPGKHDDYYSLPLQIKEKVERFSLRAEVIRRSVTQADAPDVMKGLDFKQIDESLVAEIDKKNYIPDQSVALVLPRDPMAVSAEGITWKEPVNRFRISGWWIPGLVLLGGGGIAGFLFYRRRRWVAGTLAGVTVIAAVALGWWQSGDTGGQRSAPRVTKPVAYQTWTAGPAGSDSAWFYISINPPPLSAASQKPEHITLLWDVSRSGNQRDHSKEKSILKSLMHQYKDVNVTLIPFHIAGEDQHRFRIQNGNTDALMQQIDSLQYDGASATPDPAWLSADCDEVLLFSDGIFNFREAAIEGYKVPVHTLCASKVADYSLLQQLAASTGGSFCNLLETDSKEVADKLTHRVLRLISTEIVDGMAWSLYPSGSAPVGHTLSMAGIMEGESLKLRLNFGFGSKVEHTEYVTVHADKKDDPVMLKRIWAGKMLKELLWNAETNRERITEAAKQYGFVTPFTSLIVLEELADYIQYKIVPPPELAKSYHAAYYRQLVANEAAEDEIVKGRIETLLKELDAQTEWWNTEFRPAPVPEPEPEPLPQPASAVDTLHPEVHRTADSVIHSGNASQGATTYTWDANVRKDVTIDLSGGFAVPFTLNSYASYDATVQATTQSLNFTTGTYSITSGTAAGDDPPAYASSSISLRPWNPNAPYLKKLRKAATHDKYRAYLQLKQTYHTTPAFFNDVAEYFHQQKMPAQAIRVISNLAEVGLESPELLRTLGNKLMDYKQYKEAVFVFRKVLAIRGEDPQSLRDLGLALESAGGYDEAVKTLYKIVTGEEDFRCTSLKVIVMNDINKILASHPKTKRWYIDKRLVRKEPVDVRVVLSWDQDDTDMDLWVTDPRGETCSYSNTLTAAGGKITRDVTQGFGPEEFMIRKAVKGTYVVQAHWYGSSSQELLVPANLHLSFYTRFGKQNGSRKDVTIRLEENGEQIQVGSFEFR